MKLTLARKIGGGYLILIGSAVALGLYAISQYELINRQIRTLPQENLASQQALIDLESSLRTQVSILRGDSGHGQAEIESRFQEAAKASETKLSDLRSFSATPEITATLDRIHALQKEFQESYQTGSLNPDQADLLLNLTLDEIKILRLLYQEDLQGRHDRLSDHIRRSRETMGWMLLTLASLGILISYGVTRLSKRPLRQLKNALKEMSRGKPVQTLPRTGVHEIDELAAALNQWTWKIKQLDSRKEDFISNLSHELRTPLTSLQEAANLLLDEVSGRLNERQRRLLLIIQDDTKRLLHLTTNLLELSRMRAGNLPLRLETCRIEDIARRALEELRPLAMRRDLHLELVAGQKLDAVLIDAARIHQVMINLLSNAIKFTSQGGKIRVNLHKASSRETQVSVSDTGLGIPRGDIERIFDRFYTGGGFGLGLPIAKEIILAHEGRIWVESKPGKGSTFSFTIPRKEAEARKGETSAPSQEKGSVVAQAGQSEK